MVPGFFQARFLSLILDEGRAAMEAWSDDDDDDDDNDDDSPNSDRTSCFASSTVISLANTGDGEIRR